MRTIQKNYEINDETDRNEDLTLKNKFIKECEGNFSRKILKLVTVRGFEIKVRDVEYSEQPIEFIETIEIVDPDTGETTTATKPVIKQAYVGIAIVKVYKDKNGGKKQGRDKFHEISTDEEGNLIIVSTAKRIKKTKEDYATPEAAQMSKNKV